MRQTMHQYNQSGELRLSHMERAVYNGPEQPKPEPQQAQAPTAPEAKVNVPVLNAPQAPGNASSALQWMKGKAGDIAKLFIQPWGTINIGIADVTKTAMNNLPGKADNIANQADSAVKMLNDAKREQIQPIVEKVAGAPAPIPPPLTEDEKRAFPPVDPLIAGKLDTPPQDPSLDLKEVVITEADVAAGQLLKKTEAMFDTTLKGKVTPRGWLNYLGDTNGIAQDIINTNIIADNYGTFTHANLMTKNFVVSSPASTVEAIKYVQQSLGLTPDGIFGPITYDALVKNNPDAALVLREEKAVVAPAEQKLVLD